MFRNFTLNKYDPKKSQHTEVPTTIFFLSYSLVSFFGLPESSIWRVNLSGVNFFSIGRKNSSFEAGIFYALLLWHKTIPFSVKTITFDVLLLEMIICMNFVTFVRIFSELWEFYTSENGQKMLLLQRKLFWAYWLFPLFSHGASWFKLTKYWYVKQ